MRVLALLCTLVWMSPIAPAQTSRLDGAAKNDGKSSAERRVEYAMRSYRALKLSEAQVEQFKKLLLAHESSRTAAEKEKHGKLESVLTPAQKETYRKYWNRQPGAKSPYASYDREANALASVGLGLRTMRYQLKLSASQIEQLTKILKPAGKKLMAAQAEQTKAMRGGGQRWSAEAYKKYYAPLVKAKDEVLPKIHAVLTPAQKETLTKSVERYSGYIKRYTDPEAWKKRYNKTRRPARGGAAKRTLAQEVAQAAKALGLAADSEETAVLQPMIQKVLSHRRKSSTQLAGLRKKLSKLAAKDGAEESVLTATLSALRKAQKEADVRRNTLEGELRELLTLEQEARLIGLGVLRP